MECYDTALRVKPGYERAHVNYCILGRRLKNMSEEQIIDEVFNIAL